MEGKFDFKAVHKNAIMHLKQISPRSRRKKVLRDVLKRKNRSVMA